MGHNMRLDYAKYAKRGFLLGLGLFLLGALGATAGPSLAGELPGWERTVLFDSMVLGIAVGFFSVFGFGIFLPLTD
ncbi:MULTISPECIES: DUF7860 family protein [unclassified Halobacterium]|uniref:DUF7860 family protein n=1 Tax=unclassified Halobacterium TaxID=2668073 RepID=UPI001E4691A5|nr:MULTISPECIES: hypothetical protein [unclassified Halobacterium]MCD2200719.1 hypothetical protein [Halobacterium sp. KA-4]MCD2203987.1 hypothetical protein [Halobacterium sp. KA-6]